MRIACDRFGRSYLSAKVEDKLIDICIALEALYLRGSQDSSGKGQTIGLACSMLLGQDEKERGEIFSTLAEAFKLRNNIVHGSPTNMEKIASITPNIEDFLRRSLLCLIS